MATSFKDMEALKNAVESKGVLTIPMTELRSAYGAQRLGKNIRADIQNKMEELNLGHYPSVLPANQHDEIRIYAVGSPAQTVIEAVMAPGEEGDKALVAFIKSSIKKTPQRNSRRRRVKKTAVVDSATTKENQEQQHSEELVTA